MDKFHILHFISTVLPGMLNTLLESYECDDEEIAVFSTNGPYVFRISFCHEECLGETLISYSLN